MNRAERRARKKKLGVPATTGDGLKTLLNGEYVRGYNKGANKAVTGMCFVAAKVLNSVFGFGETRLLRFIEACDKVGASAESIEEVEKNIREKFPGLSKSINGEQEEAHEGE